MVYKGIVYKGQVHNCLSFSIERLFLGIVLHAQCSGRQTNNIIDFIVKFFSGLPPDF